MQRVDVFVGGEYTQDNWYLTKLVTSNRDISMSGVDMTSDEGVVREGEVIRNSIRYTVADPSNPNQKFSGIEEKAVEGQDHYAIMVHDKDKKAFHVVFPKFLHLMRDTVHSRFNSVEEVEDFMKQSKKKVSKVENDDEEDNMFFDIKAASDHAKGIMRSNGGRGKSKSKNVAESWEWQRVDDDDGNDGEVIDDLDGVEDDAVEEAVISKKNNKSNLIDSQQQMSTLMDAQDSGDEQEEEDDEKMRDTTPTTGAMTSSNKRAREDNAQYEEAKRRRHLLASQPLNEGVASMTAADIRAAFSSENEERTLNEITSDVLGPRNKDDFTPDQRHFLSNLIRSVTTRDPATKLFRLKKM